MFDDSQSPLLNSFVHTWHYNFQGAFVTHEIVFHPVKPICGKWDIIYGSNTIKYVITLLNCKMCLLQTIFNVLLLRLLQNRAEITECASHSQFLMCSFILRLRPQAVTRTRPQFRRLFMSCSIPFPHRYIYGLPPCRRGGLLVTIYCGTVLVWSGARTATLPSWE